MIEIHPGFGYPEQQTIFSSYKKNKKEFVVNFKKVGFWKRHLLVNSWKGNSWTIKMQSCAIPVDLITFNTVLALHIQWYPVRFTFLLFTTRYHERDTWWFSMLLKGPYQVFHLESGDSDYKLPFFFKTIQACNHPLDILQRFRWWGGKIFRPATIQRHEIRTNLAPLEFHTRNNIHWKAGGETRDEKFNINNTMPGSSYPL